MKRFTIGFLIGLLFAALVVVILGFAAVNIGEKKVTVADSSTLVLHPEGDLPEQPPVQIPIAIPAGTAAPDAARYLAASAQSRGR